MKKQLTMSDAKAQRRSTVTTIPRIMRHPKIFYQLPPVYQWEFTRRHPYYLRFWQWANKYWAWRRGRFDPSNLDMFDRHDFYGSVNILSLITAIFDNYPHPSVDARRDKAFKVPFSSVHASAETYRRLATYLLIFLPEDVRRAVAQVYLRELAKQTVSEEGRDLFHAAVGSIVTREHAQLELALLQIAGDEPLHDRLYRGLADLNAASLDEDCPGILQVNYNAPLEEVMNSVKSVVMDWKRDHGAVDVRRRKDKWDDYLDVWDAREGWANGAYDGTRAKRLREIAIESGIDAATVQSRYKAAYKLLIGQDYAPLDWFLLFGGLKVSKAKWDSWRRTKHSANGDAIGVSISQSTIEAVRDSERVGDFTYFTTTDNQSDYAALLEDLRSLFAQGRTNEEFLVELELAMTPDDLQLIRDHFAEDF